jgi:hypothetical protein
MQQPCHCPSWCRQACRSHSLHGPATWWSGSPTCCSEHKRRPTMRVQWRLRLMFMTDSSLIGLKFRRKPSIRIAPKRSLYAGLRRSKSRGRLLWCTCDHRSTLRAGNGTHTSPRAQVYGRLSSTQVANSDDLQCAADGGSSPHQLISSLGKQWPTIKRVVHKGEFRFSGFTSCGSLRPDLRPA